MNLINKSLAYLNKPYSLWLLKVMIRVGYYLNGISVNYIKYHKNFKSWEFNIDGVSYLSSGAGWAYSFDFLLSQLKQLSGNQYLPKQGDVVIDIGAGVGEETIIFSKLVSDKGKVFAIEAHPRTFQALSYLIRKNALENVFSFNLALSDQTGTAEIEDSDNSLANTILAGKTTKHYKIQAMTFDEFVELNQIQRIDLVKMNVEGAEQLIIKGMTRSFSKIKHISISCHDFLYHRGGSDYFKTKKIVIDFLNGQNFNVITQMNTKEEMIEDYVYASNPNLQN